jgi:hypothetical protein
MKESIRRVQVCKSNVSAGELLPGAQRLQRTGNGSYQWLLRFDHISGRLELTRVWDDKVSVGWSR